MTRFTKKALIATAVIGTLAAAPIVYAAGSHDMPGAFMQERGFHGPMMGQMGMPGFMMGGDAMDGQMPKMTKEQIAFMQQRLATLNPEQRAFVLKRMQEHGITLPDSAPAPTTK